MYCKEIKLTFNVEDYNSQKTIFDYNYLYKKANNIKLDPTKANEYYNKLMFLVDNEKSDGVVGVYEMESYNPKKAIKCGIIPIEANTSGYTNYGRYRVERVKTTVSCVMTGEVYSEGIIPTGDYYDYFVVEGTKEERQCKLEHYQALEHKILDKNAIFYKNKPFFVEVMGKNIYNNINKVLKKK